ncbi:MAG: peptide chain release factor 1 [Elusimicrobia bacterium]|nr:peptide chain release factor 1 [Elusimicrobiota bacterium]
MEEIRYDELEQEYASIEAALSSPTPPPAEERRRMAARHGELRPAVDRIRIRRELVKAKADAEALSAGGDSELAALAREELSELGPKLVALEEALRRDLLPKDPDSDKSVYLELRAGAGGDESALFAGELMRMYSRFAEGRGWKVSVVELSKTGPKGVKQGILAIEGMGAYGWLKFEGGVHRVQRVPETEASGRIHTSTVTVAIMAEIEEEEIKIDPKDLRVDTFRAGGAGGQNVNKVETAIRITHIPSGVVVACQEERSQGQNRMRAMSILASRLAAAAKEKAFSAQVEARRVQVGTGDRSEKIRTYNFPQNRLTEHRLEQSWHNLPLIIEGELGPVLEALRRAEEEKLLAGQS